MNELGGFDVPHEVRAGSSRRRAGRRRDRWLRGRHVIGRRARTRWKCRRLRRACSMTPSSSSTPLASSVVRIMNGEPHRAVKKPTDAVAREQLERQGGTWSPLQLSNASVAPSTKLLVTFWRAPTSMREDLLDRRAPARDVEDGRAPGRVDRLLQRVGLDADQRHRAGREIQLERSPVVAARRQRDRVVEDQLLRLAAARRHERGVVDRQPDAATRRARSARCHR